MSEYLFRPATINDVSFLADVIIAAEKSNSDKLSFSTLFNVPEDKAKSLVISMLEEEVDGCELSISSFLIAEKDGEAAGAFGAWIERFDESAASGILKSNLIGFTFGRDSIEFLMTKSHLVKELVTEREPMALQLEYLFVPVKHRGKGIADGLIQRLIAKGIQTYPGLKKVQVQVFKNNKPAVKLYERNGFAIARSYKCNDPEILDYLPFNEKYIMERSL